MKILDTFRFDPFNFFLSRYHIFSAIWEAKLPFSAPPNFSRRGSGGAGAPQRKFRGRFGGAGGGKYGKVEAENYGEIGDWHLGEGNTAWLFVDEILIE